MFPPLATATTSSSNQDDTHNEDTWAGEVLGTITRANAHLHQKQQEAQDKRRMRKTTPKLEVIVQEQEIGAEKKPITAITTIQSSLSMPAAPIQSLTSSPPPQPLTNTASPPFPPPPPSFLLSPLDIRRPGAALLPAALPSALPPKRLPSMSQLPH